MGGSIKIVRNGTTLPVAYRLAEAKRPRVAADGTIGRLFSGDWSSGVVGIAEETATGAFAVHDRDGAAEVEIDGGDGMLLQFARSANERGDVVADHLRDYRPAGRVLRDGAENVRIEPRIGQDPEVFGEVKIGVAVTGDQPHEAQVGNVLHRREREDGRVALEQGLESV